MEGIAHTELWFSENGLFQTLYLKDFNFNDRYLLGAVKAFWLSAY